MSARHGIHLERLTRALSALRGDGRESVRLGFLFGGFDVAALTRLAEDQTRRRIVSERFGYQTGLAITSPLKAKNGATTESIC